MSVTNTDSSSITFAQLELQPGILESLEELGYQSPSPIQAQTIPVLLSGKDVLAQAQTGSGKTAAFLLPILNQLDLSKRQTQALILTPTRELALQVASACDSYAKNLKGLNVLALYGGQEYRTQLQQLQRGVHIVVATPGRLIDLMKRGSLKLDKLKTLVLDEADEMLRMGFIDDVEWVIQQTPEERQVALFSATMPREIHRIAQQYLRDAEEVKIEQKTATAATIRQRYWLVKGLNKLDALTRMLEVEPFDGAIIFARTKSQTLELAENLEFRGYSASALNGDMVQAQREKTVAQFKAGRLDILVATDVAARGLDVERISHVINYDIPFDTESYIHRIGRTGRAGRQGDAILFVSPREQRMLRSIEKATRQPITPIELPTPNQINQVRAERFEERISQLDENAEVAYFKKILSEYEKESELSAIDIAARLAHLMQNGKPFLLTHDKKAKSASNPRQEVAEKPTSRRSKKFSEDTGSAETSSDRSKQKPRKTQSKNSEKAVPMERFRIEIGHQHNVKPANIVGAIANEAGLDSAFIERITIHEDHSTVELPQGMPKSIFKILRKTWVCGKQLNIVRMDESAKTADSAPSDAMTSKGKKSVASPSQRKQLELKKTASRKSAASNRRY